MKLPGLRNIKTALSVLICAVTITFIDKQIPSLEITYFYAGISAVFALSSTMELSVARGKDRILGTIIGGAIGIIGGIIRLGLLNGDFSMIFLFLEIVITIQIINIVKLKVGVMIGCIMVIASFTTMTEHFVLYSIIRTIGTIYGVLIALLVNKFIVPQK